MGVPRRPRPEPDVKTTMPIRISDVLRGYGIAMASLAAALVLRLLAEPWLGPSLPYATMFGAVAAAVWFGGVGPALFVTVVGYYASTSMFLHEAGILLLLEPGHLIGLSLYLMSCLIIVGFGTAVRRARLRAVTNAARLRAILESAPLCIWVADDAACTRVWGNRTTDAVLGPGWGRLLSPDISPDDPLPFRVKRNGRDVSRDDMPLVIAGATGRTVSETEYDFEFPGGRALTLALTAVPVLDGAGRVQGAVASGVDVTGRRLLERSLRESEERLRMAQRAARIGAFEWRITDNVNVMSPDLLALYGLSPDQSIGTYDTWLNCVHPEDRAAADAAVRKSLDTDVFDHDFRVIWPDGSVRWLSARARVSRDGSGRPARMVGVNVDITDRKNAEESLRRSEHLYRAIGESINYGIWVCDPQGNNIYASDSFLRLVGLTQEECSSFGWIRVLHPDDAQATSAAWAECVRAGGPWEREHRVKGVDGQWHHVLARGVPIRDEHGSITHWAGINLDISDLKSAQEALQEADQRKNEFMATLAHELRNPLAAIRNVTRLMQGRGEDSTEARWSSGVVERQVEHLARLVEDLLDVSRITQGKVTLRRERLLLSAVVHNAVETSRHAIEAGRHHLEVSLPEEPIFLQGDLTRLAQVLENLLSNAARYTPPGGRIRLEARRDGEQAVLSIIDDGVGIPQPMLARVFEMFTQVEGAIDRATGGLGIGLTLVKRLVEMHGGTVRAQSEGPGRGSRFDVRLPLAPSRLESPPAEARRGAGTGPPPSRRILVVDDNRDAADSLAMLLQGAGHDVQVAYDGEQALQAAASMRPDLVLMDIGLPRLNGYDVARRLREQPWGSGIVLVALTGWGQEEDRRRSREAGFSLHLVKPLDPEALNDVLVSQV
jgi:PAS domain S-box-containing protein